MVNEIERLTAPKGTTSLWIPYPLQPPYEEIEWAPGRFVYRTSGKHIIQLSNDNTAGALVGASFLEGHIILVNRR